MAPKTKKKAPAKKPATSKKSTSAAAAKPAASMPVAARAHNHAKGEACCSCNCKIWTGVIALIIGAAAGYVLATM